MPEITGRSYWSAAGFLLVLSFAYSQPPFVLKKRWSVNAKKHYPKGSTKHLFSECNRTLSHWLCRQALSPVPPEEGRSVRHSCMWGLAFLKFPYQLARLPSQGDGCHISALTSNSWVCEVWCVFLQVWSLGARLVHWGCSGRGKLERVGHQLHEAQATWGCTEATTNGQHTLTALHLSHSPKYGVLSLKTTAAVLGTSIWLPVRWGAFSLGRVFTYRHIRTGSGQ